MGEHTQEEHIPLTLVLRYLQSLLQYLWEMFENPIGKTGSRQTDFPVHLPGILIGFLDAEGVGGIYIMTLLTLDPILQLHRHRIPMGKPVSISDVASDFGSIAIGHGETGDNRIDQVFQFRLVHACRTGCPSYSQLKLVPMSRYIRIVTDEAVEKRHN